MEPAAQGLRDGDTDKYRLCNLAARVTVVIATVVNVVH